jgi:hypothetical protein
MLSSTEIYLRYLQVKGELTEAYRLYLVPFAEYKRRWEVQQARTLAVANPDPKRHE